jgi:hypothetical protein
MLVLAFNDRGESKPAPFVKPEPKGCATGQTCYTGVEMPRVRSVKVVISKAAQAEVARAASAAVRKVNEILEQVNEEAKEFQKRRLKVRERIESGARRTTGRIV